jgi:hypothetical protein
MPGRRHSAVNAGTSLLVRSPGDEIGLALLHRGYGLLSFGVGFVFAQCLVPDLVGRFGRRDRAALQCIVQDNVERLCGQGWGSETHDQCRDDEMLLQDGSPLVDLLSLVMDLG